MNKQILLFFLCVAFATLGRAQLPNSSPDPTYRNGHTTSMSPQGSSQSFTNLFSGTASFNVPIYNCTIDGLDLGVSLGYACRGLQVDEVASDVGAGWNLTAAPYIERLPNGIEDEVCLKHNSDTVEGEWIYQRKNGNRNTDVFVAHLATGTVKFCINPKDVGTFSDTNFHVAFFPEDEYKVELYYYDYSPSSRVTGWITWAWGTNYWAPHYIFKIIDSKGNSYFFDKRDIENFKEYQWPDGSTTTYAVNSKWWVSKIQTATGKEIKYTYEEKGVLYKLYHQEEIVEQFPETIDLGSQSIRAPGSKPYIQKSKNVVWDGVVQRLKRIEYPGNTKVDFIEHPTYYRKDVPELKVLDKIIVYKGYDSTSSNKIEYRLGLGYFYAGGSPYSKELGDAMVGDALDYRLKLKSVLRTVNENPTAVPYYTFEYNTTPLPPRLSPKQDYYGFYNGKAPVTLSSGDYNIAASQDPPTFSLPDHDFMWIDTPPMSGYPDSFMHRYGHNKTPDSGYIAACVLTKVTNAMGGKTEFYYEPHQLYDYPTEKVWCDTREWSRNTYDGLRIQRIVYNDGFSNDNTTTTRYVYEGGLRFYRKLYYWYALMYPGYDPPSRYNEDFDPVARKWFSKPVSHHDINDTYHGYSHVTEIKEGFNAELISKTKTSFTNVSFEKIWDVHQYNDWNTALSLMSHGQVGNVLERREYIGNADTPHLTTINTYEIQGPADSAWKRPPMGSHYPGPHGASFNALSLYNMLISPSEPWGRRSTNENGLQQVFANSDLRVVKTKTIRRSGTSVSLDSSSYEYDKRDNLMSVKWKDSRGHDYIRKIVYNYSDISNPHGPSDTNALFQYKVRETILKGDADTMIANSLLEYFSNNVPKKLLSDKMSAPGEYVTYMSPGKKMDEENTLIDTKGNVSESRMEDTTRYRAQLWDTQLNEKIAEATNAKLSQISYTSFEGFKSSGTYTYYDRGNWDFNPSEVFLGSALPGTSNPGHAHTGKYCYRLTNNWGNRITRPLLNDKTYYLTFWADKTPVVKIDATTLTPKASAAANGWQMYTCYIPLSLGAPTLTRTLSIENSSTFERFIDEVRLHPVGAAMTTYTHEPLLGTSSVNDAQNNIIYTEYDAEGNASITRDIYGNIITQVERVIRGAKW